MAVRYTLFDGEQVSRPWAAVLSDMRRDVQFRVNEGHRTLARQRWFYQCMLSKACNNGNLAAFPSPFAPHIRSGRADHAVDFDNPEPVVTWLWKAGLKPTRPAGAGTSKWEPWHIEVDGRELAAYAKRHRHDEFDVLPKHVEHAVRKLIYHRHQAIDEAKTGKGPKYEKAVRWRDWWRRRVEGMLRRARRKSTRRLLRKALDTN